MQQVLRVLVALICVSELRGAGNEHSASPVDFDVSLSAANPEGRVVLSPGGVHVVDDFVSRGEIAYLRRVLNSLGDWTGNASDVYAAVINNSSCKSCGVRGGRFGCPELTSVSHATYADPVPFISAMQDRVVDYANRHLWLNTSLTGNHSYNGRVYKDLVDLRRYFAADPNHAQVSLHTDTDWDGRCLSAAIYLNGQGGDDGIFRLHACVRDAERCHALQGERLREAYGTGLIKDYDNLRTVAEAQTIEGRLVYFLSENIHSVRRIFEDRDVIFIWLRCSTSRGFRFGARE